MHALADNPTTFLRYSEVREELAGLVLTILLIQLIKIATGIVRHAFAPLQHDLTSVAL